MQNFRHLPLTVWSPEKSRSGKCPGDAVVYMTRTGDCPGVADLYITRTGDCPGDAVEYTLSQGCIFFAKCPCSPPPEQGGNQNHDTYTQALSLFFYIIMFFLHYHQL